ATAWGMLILLAVSGLAFIVAMGRAGMRIFWASQGYSVPRVRVIEMAPIVLLLALSAVLTLEAGPAMRYLTDTAQSLHSTQGYVNNVMLPK
ncbi:MAG: monovalent cation/H+ antiporter subunit D, partial [Burkholderiales bacterium]